MVEVSRISRGNIDDLADLKVKDFDTLVILGGFRAAKNLSTFAITGPDLVVDP